MALRRFDPRRREREPQKRINHRIRVPEVRVIDANGEMLGILKTPDALRIAREQAMDLVEINPKAVPPVCKILDFGKFKYDEKKKAREAKRKQSTVEVKEIKLRPKTDDHDLDFKMRAARRFLESGNKVKFTVRFRGRELAHPEKAREQLEWIERQCEDLGNVEVHAVMEGRTMGMLITPKPTVLQAVATLRAAAEKNRKEALAARLAAKGKPREDEQPEESAPPEPGAPPADGEAEAQP
ncbi:MAG: translation initiation factor IF-3 [Deltaproteobacteria bacterium]|nr:translation initiation factor IF-3 [Deltaproteobacteria bacterium]